MKLDVRLTPACRDGGAWTAQLLSPRAKAIFRADEIVLTAHLISWLRTQAADAHLLVD